MHLKRTGIPSTRGVKEKIGLGRYCSVKKVKGGKEVVDRTMSGRHARAGDGSVMRDTGQN